MIQLYEYRAKDKSYSGDRQKMNLMGAIDLLGDPSNSINFEPSEVQTLYRAV